MDFEELCHGALDSTRVAIIQELCAKKTTIEKIMQIKVLAGNFRRVDKPGVSIMLHLCNKTAECCFFSKNGVAIAPVLTMMLLHKPDGPGVLCLRASTRTGLYPKHNI
jgi:hypothetical protein